MTAPVGSCVLVIVMCQFGTLPADLTRRNMELFASDVLPALKALN